MALFPMGRGDSYAAPGWFVTTPPGEPMTWLHVASFIRHFAPLGLGLPSQPIIGVLVWPDDGDEWPPEIDGIPTIPGAPYSGSMVAVLKTDLLKPMAAAGNQRAAEVVRNIEAQGQARRPRRRRKK